jgi:hypothetical protein
MTKISLKPNTIKIKKYWISFIQQKDRDCLFNLKNFWKNILERSMRFHRRIGLILLSMGLNWCSLAMECRKTMKNNIKIASTAKSQTNMQQRRNNSRDRQQNSNDHKQNKT